MMAKAAPAYLAVWLICSALLSGPTIDSLKCHHSGKNNLIPCNFA